MFTTHTNDPASPAPGPVLGSVLRDFDLTKVEKSPRDLPALWQAAESLRRSIPELNYYEVSTKEGALEFPRTMAALGNLGIMLRAADACAECDESLHPAAASRASLKDEYLKFSQPQPVHLRISEETFERLARLYLPIKDDPAAVLTVATAVAYGDIFKMPGALRRLVETLGDAQAADHDTALQHAFQAEHIGKFRELLPTYFSLQPEWQRRITKEVIKGLNLGHVLQSETCAAALRGLRDLVQSDADGPVYWLLPTIMDISGARADAAKPETWIGSALVNRVVGRNLLLFHQALPTLPAGESACLADFYARVSRQPFYDELRGSGKVPAGELPVVTRLGLYLSWETDDRPCAALIDAWAALPESNKALLSRYFLNDGFDPAQPKVVISYLPYVFSQLYGKHFAGAELPTGLARALTVICDAVRAAENYAETAGAAVVQVSGQQLWFNQLRGLTKEELTHGRFSFDLQVPEAGGPGVIPQLVLRRDDRS